MVICTNMRIKKFITIFVLLQFVISCSKTTKENAEAIISKTSSVVLDSKISKAATKSKATSKAKSTSNSKSKNSKKSKVKSKHSKKSKKEKSKAIIPEIENASLKQVIIENSQAISTSDSTLVSNSSTSLEVPPSNMAVIAVEKESNPIEPALEKPLELARKSFNINYYIDEALANSPDVQERLANKSESKYLVKQSYSGVLPFITARAGVGAQHSESPNIEDRNLNAEEYSVDLHQNIFGEGRITDVKINKSVLNSKTYELEQIRNLITLSTIEAYLNTLRYSAIEKIQQDSIAYHMDTLSKTKARLDAGLIRASDLYLTQARTANAKSNLYVTKSQLQKSKNSLYRYSTVSVEGELQDFDLPNDLPKNFDEAWSFTMESSPIIKAKFHEIKTSEYIRKKESIALYPSLSADLAAQKTSDSSGIIGKEKDLSAMLNLRYSFNFGSQYYKTSAAKSKIKSARSSHDKSKNEVYKSLSDSYNDYAQINERIEFLKQNRDFLQQTVGKHQKEFDSGFRPLLDLLNTKSEFFNAEVQYVNALYDRKILAYTILANIGNLLTHFGK